MSGRTAGLKIPCRPIKRHALAVEHESRRKDRPLENLTVKRRLFAEKLERPQANLAIESVGRHGGGDQTTGPASKSTAAPRLQ